MKAYLLVWGLLAAGALGYLVTLAWPLEFLAPAAPARPQMAEPEQSLRVATKALAEVSTVRRAVSDMQKDLGQLKDTVEQHETQEKAVETRLSALEERVTTMSVAATTPAASAKQKSADKAQQKTVVLKGTQKDAEPRTTTARVITMPESTQAAPAPAAETPAPQIETGSIVPAAPIVFGSPVVRQAPEPAQDRFFAVQLGAGPSLDGLRRSWGQLAEQHGSALATLQPRYVPPRKEGGPYRLLAGPLPSKAEADQVCADMAMGRSGCFATTFMGEPL